MQKQRRVVMRCHLKVWSSMILDDNIVLLALDRASTHGGLHVVDELFSVALELLRCLCTNRVSHFGDNDMIRN